MAENFRARNYSASKSGNCRQSAPVFTAAVRGPRDGKKIEIYRRNERSRSGAVSR